MKRMSNIFEKIIDPENLRLADQVARKGKKEQYGIFLHDRNVEANIEALHTMLVEKTYQTSPYTTFTIHEPKERVISRLPYFPDRILHHAIMNVLEPHFVRSFTTDTYSCIKGRGIHGAADAVKRALRDQAGTEYYLKLDIKKFYPNITHRILKAQLRRKFKDPDLLWLLDEIIDSSPGVPIGNYLSQYFANFYLSGFDHWIKEVKKVKYYFRYADDLVIFSDSKEYLHGVLADIKENLATNLNLEIKGNYKVCPTQICGLDFVGYVFYHTHTRLRKSIKQGFARMMARRPNMKSIASYYGWIKHCNGRHLFKKLVA